GDAQRTHDARAIALVETSDFEHGPSPADAAWWARLLCRPDRVDSAADELELVHDGRVVGPRSPDRINGSNHRAITDEEPVPDASRVGGLGRRAAPGCPGGCAHLASGPDAVDPVRRRIPAALLDRRRRRSPALDPFPLDALREASGH